MADENVKRKYKLLHGFHYVRDKNDREHEMVPGNIVELTKAQYESMKDKWEPVLEQKDIEVSEGKLLPAAGTNVKPATTELPPPPPPLTAKSGG